MNFLTAKNTPRFSTLFFELVLDRLWCCAGYCELPEKNRISEARRGFCEQIRFSDGHPFVCHWRSYYQQGFKQTEMERITMQTLFVGIAFSTMVVLPLLVAKWSGACNEDFRALMRKVE